MTTALILYACGLPLAAVWFAYLFRDLPHDTDLDIFDDDGLKIHGILAALLFVLLWPIVMLAVLYIYLTER